MSSQGDPQFDEFLRYSSPDTDPPLIQTLMNSKMGLYHARFFLPGSNLSDGPRCC